MVVPRLLGCIDGTERVSNFSSFWMAMAPSRLRWLKKVFCFLFMEKLGFRKVSERFLEGFCSAGLTVDRYEFPTLSIFIVVTYKPLARTQNPFAGGKKQHQTTFKRQGMFISKLHYILIDSLRSTAKIRISHTKSYKNLKMSLLLNFPTLTKLGLPVKKSGRQKAVCKIFVS